MLERLRETWLPRLLFLATLLSAAALGGLVLAAPPLIENEIAHAPLLRLFAADLIVRRTALASALGLAVTAFVFFRPRDILLARKPKPRSVANQIAGA